jgi:flagellar basal-body rod modification protein FlgD
MAAHLENQNMFDEIDNTQFLAQLAQFSTLTQINELTSVIKTNTAISLIGKEVTIPAVDGSNNFKTGTVDKVGYTDGVPYIFVDGSSYLLSDVVEIKNPVTNK